MTMSTPAYAALPDSEYEDLLGLWSDLESALCVVLINPLQIQEFVTKLHQLDEWLQDLVAHDIDAALYLMFQLASTSTVGYSASHALVCGTLCHIMAGELALTATERNSLVRAALTMNIGMTALQDELAVQRERPNAAQQEAIANHPVDGLLLLQRLYVSDSLWLDVVHRHHAGNTDRTPLAQQAPQDRLARILSTVDRYAAMISPRKSRAGRSVTESINAILGPKIDERDEVGQALLRSVGLCPPGTFVKLDNGETAIVLRRSDTENHPVVASLLDPMGEHLLEPHLHQTSLGKPRVLTALPRAAVTLELNHRTMVRLGLYAAQGNGGLRGLITGQRYQRA